MYFLKNIWLLYDAEDNLQKDRLVTILFRDHEGNLFESITEEEINELLHTRDLREFLFKLFARLKEVYMINDEQIEKIQQLITATEERPTKLLSELLRLRFEKEFETLQKDSYKIDGTENVEIFDEEDDTLILEELSNTTRRLVFYPVLVKKEGYTKPYKIGNIEVYPFVLAKQVGNTIEIASRSYKRIRNAIKKIKEEKSVSLKKIVSTVGVFNISPFEIFYKLRESGGYIKKIKVNDYHYTIKLIAKGDTYIPTNYFNLERFLMNPEDILKLKELHIEYFGFDDNPAEATPFVLYVNQTTVKTKINDQEIPKRIFELKPVFKKKNLLPEQREAIYRLFEDFGISLDYSYEAPISYYFNRMIVDSRNFKSYFHLIKRLYPNDNIVQILEDNGILNSERINLDNLGAFIERYITQAIDSQGMIKIKDQNKMEKFEILSVHYLKDNKEIQLKAKRTWDDENGRSYEFYLSAIIPLKRHRNTQRQRRKRLTHVILEDISIYDVLNDLITENYERFYESIYYKALAYLIYYHGETLEKESAMTFLSLKKNLEAFSSGRLTPAKKRALGNKVEEEINILLKYLYGNYIPYGGKNKPDGVLILVKRESESTHQYIYLVDSKQHSSIRKPELRKMKEYFESFAEKEGLFKTNKGIFIISRAALTTDSLNYSARKELMGGTGIKLGITTAEFIMGLFEIYKEHRFLIESMGLSDKLKDAFIEIFDKSIEIETLSQLIEHENQKLDELKDKLKEVLHQYYPQRINREL